MTEQENKKIPVGISSCLLGMEVRFNGGHKRDKYVTGTLSDFFTWKPYCPEVGIGLTVPRNTVRLEGHGDEVKLIDPKEGLDHTQKMVDYSHKVLNAMRENKKSGVPDVYGFILKSKSPSCGMTNVKLYNPKNSGFNKKGMGIFAQALMEKFPNLPVEEEGRLHDPRLRENWIARVFSYYDFRSSLFPEPTTGKLVAFHTRYKFTILSHCEKAYKELGSLVANAAKDEIEIVIKNYEQIFMSALKKYSTVPKNINVLLHLIGFFKKQLDSQSRAQIIETIYDYREGIVPLVVPTTMVSHYAKVLKIDYLEKQAYLTPHPKELALRNFI